MVEGINSIFFEKWPLPMSTKILHSQTVLQKYLNRKTQTAKNIAFYLQVCRYLQRVQRKHGAPEH